MNPNEEKEDWIGNEEKENCLHYYEETPKKIMMTSVVWSVLILLEQKINLNVMKMYVKMKIFVELYDHLKTKVY